MRDRISLNGTWQFAPTPGAAYLTEEMPARPDELREIRVPSCFQAEFEDLRDYADVVFYERTFTVPASWGGRAVRLHFGAVDLLCEVWVDGFYIGRHEGMFLPFVFDITHVIRPGEQQRLVVRVTDAGGAAYPKREYRVFPEVSFKEHPHGKQSWYGPIGGIWQDVTLEAGSATYVYRAMATPDVAGEQAHFRVILAGPHGPLSPNAAPTLTTIPEGRPVVAAPPGLAVQVRVTAPDGSTFASAPAPVDGGEARASVSIPNPALWDLEHPNLYDFSVILLANGRPVDLYQDYFGMRWVEVKENRIYLNGKPLYIRAALDQDYYPTTLWTPPSDAFLKDQVILAKNLGLNMLRCHIKVPDPRYLYWADKLGMLVWEEYGNFSHLEGRAGDLGRATLEGMIERDFNRPATIIWSVINESWGLNLSREKDREWLKQHYYHFKTVDPTRIICDNSACPGNFHMASDIADYHSYYAYPDHFDQWEAWVKDLASRPAWLWSPHGDAAPKGTEPLMNSEFGNWGLPDANGLVDENGEEPWWFNTGDEWSWGIVHPKGVQERFAGSALPTAFGSYKEFVTATQVQQFRAFKHEIEAMRQQGALNGYVITEFTDIHWECNGLVDQMRNPKAGHELYKHVIAGTQLIARPALGRWAFAPGEAVSVKVEVASDSATGAEGYRVRWWLETGVTTALPAPGAAPALGAVQGVLTDVTLPAFDVAEAGELVFQAPAGAQRLRLHLVLVDAVGREVGRGYEDFVVFGAPSGTGSLWLPVDLSGLSGPLKEMGYQVSIGGQPASGQVAVVCKLDDTVAAFATTGGRVLLLASSREALPWAPADAEHWDKQPGSAPVRIVERKEKAWQGDWASGFHWLSPDLLPTPALENPLDLPWAGVLPEHMILGYDSQDDWLAGYTLGWIQAPAATVAGFRLGDGAVLVTTFRLAETLGAHPAAQSLMAALLTRVVDSAFRPKTQAGLKEALS